MDNALKCNNSIVNDHVLSVLRLDSQVKKNDHCIVRERILVKTYITGLHHVTLLSVRNFSSKLVTFRQQEKAKNRPKFHICNKTGSRVIFLHFKIS